LENKKAPKGNMTKDKAQVKKKEHESSISGNKKRRDNT
jgi:hypothetical protein